MPTSYHDCLADIALRVNALTGALATDLETSFNVRPLTTTQFQSARFPFSAHLSALATTENIIALAVANTYQHLWRKYLLVTSGNLANATALPVAISSVPVIGVIGDVRDSGNSAKLTEKSFQEIQRIIRATYAQNAYYHYTVTSSRTLYHTRTNVVVDLCTFDRDARLEAIAADGNLLFPEAYPLYLSGSLKLLTRDGRFQGQAEYYGAFFDEAINAITQGVAGFAPLPNPPITVPAA